MINVEKLKNQCLNCEKCPLHKGRTNVVFGCGNENADIIDVYEAMDMFLPGMFAYRSILKGGIPVEIPDLRDKAVRDQWRNDTACCDPKAAGDMLQPTFSKGTPDIADDVYEFMKAKWKEECEDGGDNYRSKIFGAGTGKQKEKAK